MNYKRFFKKALYGTLLAALWAAYCIYFANLFIPHMALRCLFAGFALAALSEL